jgi:hypothetical protein
VKVGFKLNPPICGSINATRGSLAIAPFSIPSAATLPRALTRHLLTPVALFPEPAWTSRQTSSCLDPPFPVDVPADDRNRHDRRKGCQGAVLPRLQESNPPLPVSPESTGPHAAICYRRATSTAAIDTV